MKHGAGVGSAAFVPPGSIVALRSERRVDLARTLPARLEVRLQIVDARGPHGPRIALRAALVLPALVARVILRHRVPTHGSARSEFTRQVTIVPPEARMERADDRTRSVPAGSLLTLRLIDHEDRPITDEQILGECADGTLKLDLPIFVDAIASAWVVPKEWSEERGPTLKLCGALTLRRGLTLRVGTRPRRDADRNAESYAIDLLLVRPGLTPHYDEKTFEGGLPLNWWALVAFLDARDQIVGGEHLIGRLVVI